MAGGVVELYGNGKNKWKEKNIYYIPNVGDSIRRGKERKGGELRKIIEAEDE